MHRRVFALCLAFTLGVAVGLLVGPIKGLLTKPAETIFGVWQSEGGRLQGEQIGKGDLVLTIYEDNTLVMREMDHGNEQMSGRLFRLVRDSYRMEIVKGKDTVFFRLTYNNGVLIMEEPSFGRLTWTRKDSFPK